MSKVSKLARSSLAPSVRAKAASTVDIPSKLTHSRRSLRVQEPEPELTRFSKPLVALPSHSVADRVNTASKQPLSTHASVRGAASTRSTAVHHNEAPPGACSMSEIMECVVKVFVTSSAPNYLQPWQTKPLSDHLGSGFVVKGRRILTNAHVIADAVQVMVRRPGSPQKFVAKVVAAGHECDLAVLEVEDPLFWASRPAALNLDGGLSSSFAPELDELMDMPSDADVSDAEASYTHAHTRSMPASPLAAEEAAEEEFTDSEPAPLEPLAPLTVPWSSAVFAPDAHPLVGEDASQHAQHSGLAEFRKEPGALYLSRETPLLQESVVVVGYPMGGDNLCITQGVVSRVEPVHYAHAGSYLLAIQIDAAINPGNSGGPALVNGRVVGVAFQNVTNASSVGYIIPCSVVQHFLRDVEMGGYRIPDKAAARMLLNQRSAGKTRPAPVSVKPVEDTQEAPADPFPVPSASSPAAPLPLGFCASGLGCQDTFNPSLQRHLGIAGKPAAPFTGALAAAAVADKLQVFRPDATPAAYLHYPRITLSASAPPVPAAKWASAPVRVGRDPLPGVMVLKVSRVSPLRGVLRRGDVLVAVDGVPVAGDGTVLYRGYERMSFDYIFSLKHRDELCTLSFLRKAAPGSPHPFTLQEATVSLRPVPSLVPATGYDLQPHYWVFGGLVCVPLTVPYLQEFGKDWFSQAPKELVDLTGQPLLFQGHEAVVMSQVLPDSSTAGYSMIDAQLKRADGVMLRSLPHLRAVVVRALGRAALRREILSLVDAHGAAALSHALPAAHRAAAGGEAPLAAVEEAADSEVAAAAARIRALLALMTELLAVASTATTPAQVADAVSSGRSPEDQHARYLTALRAAAAVAPAPVDDDSAPAALFASLLSEDSPYKSYLAARDALPVPLDYDSGRDGLLLASNSEFVQQEQEPLAGDTAVAEAAAAAAELEALPRLGGDNAYNQHAHVAYCFAPGASAAGWSVPAPPAGTVITRAALHAVFGTAAPPADAAALMSAARGADALVLELGDARSIVLDAADAAQRHEEIVVKHNIPYDEFLGN